VHKIEYLFYASTRTDEHKLSALTPGQSARTETLAILRFSYNQHSSSAFVNGIRNLISALVRDREYKGYQLSHAWGNIPDEDFDKIEEKYIPHYSPVSLEMVVPEIQAVAEVFPEFIKPELVRLTYKVSAKDANKALLTAFDVVDDDGDKVKIGG
jgi:hypothetical protein